MFEDCFMKTFLPIAKTEEVTVLIGDNLSSQFSSELLEVFKWYIIKYICLPANSTDKMQPLDATNAPVKESLKVSYWVVVKYGTTTSSKSKSSIHYFEQFVEDISNVQGFHL